MFPNFNEKVSCLRNETRNNLNAHAIQMKIKFYQLICAFHISLKNVPIRNDYFRIKNIYKLIFGINLDNEFLNTFYIKTVIAKLKKISHYLEKYSQGSNSHVN